MLNKKSTIDIEALLSVPSVSSFDTSRDGRLVFSSNKSGQFQLYLGNISQETDEAPGYAQITFDAESKVSPRFSPGGSSLLFASDFQGDEKFDLYLLDLNTKESRDLTPRSEYAIYPNANFSKNDSRKISLVANEQGKFATYVIDSESLHSSRVSYHNLSDSYATISPDSRWIAYSSNVSGQEMGIFVSSLENPAKGVANLSDEKGIQVDAEGPEWSPDAKQIAFFSASKGWYDVGLWIFETGEIRWLTKSSREYYEPVFSNGGRKLAYTVNSGGDIKLVVHNLSDEDGSVVEFKHGIISSPRFSYDDKSIYFLFTGPRNPPDIWSYRFDDEKFTQITNSLPDEFEVSSFVEGEQIIYPSKKDGMRVPALLYMPNRSISSIQNQTAKKKITRRMRGKDTREHLPAVIEIHGGPTSQALNTWTPLVQALVAKGFVVLRPNYRGSTGYGKSYREANRFVMGDLDLADCVSGRDFLIERRLADPARIAVAGGSFGGYLTMCCLSMHPDGWACGSALVPFLNWFTEIQNEREDLRFWDLQNMGDPEKDAKRLHDASPIFFVDKIRAPVLLVAGGNDPRCPLEETLQASTELQKLGRPVELVSYMDEGHGFRITRNKVGAYSKIIDFLEKYLSSKD
ncbi:MAG: S9 family peptidase [Nitrososphaerales archaeon]